MTTLVPAAPTTAPGRDTLVARVRPLPAPPPARHEPPVQPLPLPAGGWGAAEALTAWAAARALLPPVVTATVPPGAPARVVSALTTVVLQVGPWAVKVYPPGTDADHLGRVAGALDGSSSAHLPVAAPVETAHGVVAVSAWLPATRPVGWTATARLLRAFHTEHADALLPRWQPLSRLEPQVATLPEDAAAVLRTARDELLAALDAVPSELGVGPIHGDVSPLNVMRTADGARLIDLDWAAAGPREYDLAAAARRLRDGEIGAGTYRRFCAAYGHDVRSWAGLPLVDRVAELGALVFRLWDCRHHGWSTGWLDAELASWRHPL